MSNAPEHRPELLAMREEVTRLHTEQYEAFKCSTTSTVNAVLYDVALQRYVAAKIAYEAAVRAAVKAYDEAREPKSEVSYGQPF